MIRVLSVFGTRPEAIKMAPVVMELRRQAARVESVVCTTAQHREMLDQVLSIFGIIPDLDLNLMEPNQSPASITARAVMAVSGVLEKVKPDWILVQGDTTTAMAAALAGFYSKVPVGHVEAGLRTGNRYSPFPEEMNRRLVGALATLHFAPTQTGADALMAEGISSDSISVTGNTVIDALQWIVAQTPPQAAADLLRSLGLASNGRSPKLILVTAHRRENFGLPLENICRALRTLAERNKDVVIVYPVHLNPNVQGTVNRLLEGVERIHLLRPLSYEVFSHLMKASYLILTDSGGIQEEGPALGKPVLVLRTETERPEAVESGTARVVGWGADEIVRETELLLLNRSEYDRMAAAVSPYGDGHAAQKIVNCILAKASGAAVRLKGDVG